MSFQYYIDINRHRLNNATQTVNSMSIGQLYMKECGHIAHQLGKMDQNGKMYTKRSQYDQSKSDMNRKIFTSERPYT